MLTLYSQNITSDIIIAYKIDKVNTFLEIFFIKKFFSKVKKWTSLAFTGLSYSVRSTAFFVRV